MTQEELLQLIKQADREGLKALDLSKAELTSLPPEIGQLFNLTTLNLSNNRLSSLPVEIFQLHALIRLDLSNNELSGLPAEFCKLHNLTTLSLYFNKISHLPIELFRLHNLTTLYLSNNLLKEIPLDFFQLQSLVTLYLGSNQLHSLPSEIAQLQSLTSLILRDNELTHLPPEIGQLKNLVTLDLSSNKLRSIPLEISYLQDLTTLYLSSNPLSRLLPEIGNLQHLMTLNLISNELSSLPPEIGQLKRLKRLNLVFNKLDKLPPEIGQLQDLAVLDLSSNKLSRLPPEIGQLQNLTTLDLSANPLESPPPEIVDKGIQEIRKYFRQLEVEGVDTLYEAKLLILGEPGAGKTSLANKIRNPIYSLREEQSTEGIEVFQWRFPLNNGKYFRVNIWDFGGQEIYHATHQFFLTKRSLYILVADIRKEDTDFYYWMSVVELLSDNSPLLIIKNEKQDRKREISEHQLRQFSNLKETLATNLKTNRGLAEILTTIQHYISTLPHVGSELPKTWVKVRNALERDSRNYISLDEFLDLCQQHGFTRWEDKMQLSGYLHDLGVFLHFQEDDLLRKTVILKPSWGTDAVYKVLDNHHVVQNLGKFTRADLAHIWCEDQYLTMRAELLRLMMNFKLCYEIPSTPGNYIAPQLLTENPPSYTWDFSNNLMLRYEYEFMPKGILTRFIVETHSLIDSQSYVWRSGVILRQDQARAEVIEYYRYHKGEIWVRVSGKRMKELMAVIRHELKQIHDSYGNRLKYSELVPCNCSACKNNQVPHFYRLINLYRRLDNNRDFVECEQSYESVDVHSLIDEVITKNSEMRGQESTLMLFSRDQVFISYSHKDQKWLEALQIHLKPRVRNQTLKLWDDTQIKPGAEWRKEITAALAAAKVAVLLVSPDFLASDFIDKNELPPLLDAAENEGLTIIWIPVRASSYKVTVIEKYQAAHSPNQPLARLSNDDLDQACVDICEKIQAAVNS